MKTRFVVLLLTAAALAQEAPPNGPRRVDPAWHALTGATVHVGPGQTLEGATVVLRGDRIASVSKDAPPAGARVWKLAGHHIYAGLIDAYVPVDAPAYKGRHWNTKVTPGRRVRDLDKKTAEELRELGFTAAAIAPRAGILRGRAAVVSTAPADADLSVKRPSVYREGAYQSLAFERVRRSYPSSLMGAIALIRQSLYDGLAPNETLLFATDDEIDALRAAKIAREFKRNAIVLGTGTEFRRLDAIKKDGLPLIVPVRFPQMPDVTSFGAQEEVDLRTLMTWEQAPTNPRRLDAAGLKVALTTHRLRRKKTFPKSLLKAARHGLEPERALALLTTNPAEILGVADRMGTIEGGKLANLVVTDRPLFESDRLIRWLWIDGRAYAMKPADGAGLPGEWNAGTITLSIDRKHKITVRFGGKPIQAKKVRVRGSRVSFAYEDTGGLVTLSGVIDGTKMSGHGIRADGARFAWEATRTGDVTPHARKEREPADVPEKLGYPFGPYALDAPPTQPATLVVRAHTVWTSGPKGVLRDGQIEVEKGKITYVGPARKTPAEHGIVSKVDHLTPGIIDCHSHTGISRGINDSGQAVTAEVRIGDVTNPDHISWYRQLAAGVTTVNTLHGSANPIGGQNQINKNRWGALHPDDMHMKGAKPGIKFALGENVKQSNWGDDFKTRYPQTRMGVETLIRDRFLAAREYLKAGDRRKIDLELEALGEILQGERLIHCHSYRQDEILMLCRIAQEFGFKIGTFQHVLEGYKVAEAIKEHALGGSAFSDWWAYKVEVQDAIPHNGALMHDVGVLVTFNSDSNDLARRMNTEAAKAVKYGGVSPVEALKFVTINAAKQLAIEDRVGSLETGKDADFAIWSGDPLSTYTTCLETWIDGRRYFSVAADKEHRARIAAERRRIIQKLLGRKKEKRDRDEEDEEEEGKPTRLRQWLERTRADNAQCGECGCFEEVGR